MKKILSALFLIELCTFSHAEIYKWVDENGKIHFGDNKPETMKAEKISLEINTYKQVLIDNSIYDVGPKKVVMYSTTWCGYCKKARKYFAANNIPFIEYDIEKNKRAKVRYDKMGAKGVPVILVGKKRMSGFSEKGFNKIYK